MDAIHAYLSHALGSTLLDCVTFISSFVLLHKAKRSLQQGAWIKSHLASLLSILCLLPTMITIFAWQIGIVSDPLLFATILLFLPAVATIAWLVLAGVVMAIPAKYSFRQFPSFKIASALLIVSVMWSFVFSLQIADWNGKYAQYGSDMEKIIELFYDECFPTNCFGIANAIAQNTNATPEVIELIADRSDHPTVICSAMRNPNVSTAFLEKWANNGSGVVKQCADQALNRRKHL